MTDLLFEFLFKYPLATYRQGELLLAPLLPPSLLILLGGLIAAALLGSLPWTARSRGLAPRRRWLLVGLQIGFVALAVLLLARPVLQVSRLTPGANVIAVVVDTSRSMGFPAADPAGESRLDVARRVGGELLPALRQLGSVTTFTFAGDLQRRELADLTATGTRTRMVAALQDVLGSFRDAPLAAVVVVSDGAENGRGAVDLSGVEGAGVPVHVVGVGSTRLAGEARIDDVAAPTDALPRSRVVADVTIHHASRGAARLTVRDGGRLIAAQDVELDPRTPLQPLAVEFDSGPGGIRELTFELEPPAGDLLAGNNRVSRLLTVAEQTRRILYLEGEPRWEYKFLRRALDGDPTLAVSSWLRTSQRKTYRQSVLGAQELQDGFPASREALYGYDVVVLGSLGADYLSEAQHAWLEAYVGERGGSLLALAGREALADGGWASRPLADVLPVTLTRSTEPGYQPRGGPVTLTAEGRRSAITRLPAGEGADPWSTLPAIGDHQRLGAVKAAATVLLDVQLDAGSAPLLVTQPYGRGTAAVLATATTWRWRMRTDPQDLRHTLFWRQLLRQLAQAAQPRRELEVRAAADGLLVRFADRDAAYRPRPPTAARATVTGPAMGGAGPTRLLPLRATSEPGVLAAHLDGLAPAVYRVDLDPGDDSGILSRFIQLGGADAEQASPAQNEALLRRVAGVTGGRYWQPDEAAAIADSLRLSAAGVRHREQLPLWDMPALFLLLLLWKCGEWWLRRGWGLI